MHPEIGAVGAELLGRDGQLNRLLERVGGRVRLRLRRRGPMAEGEEADVFHGMYVGMMRLIRRTGSLKAIRAIALLGKRPLSRIRPR
jgi:hypothetical protein